MVDDHSQYVTQLFEQYRRPLMRYLTDLLSSPDDAEDIVQETYVRLLKAQELDRSGSRIRGYIFKIATNLAYDRFRHRKVAGEKIPYEDTKTYEHTNLVGSNPQPDRIVDFEQSLQLVKQALLELLTIEVRSAHREPTSGPLMVALHRMAASLVKCFQGVEKNLEIPVRCKSADTDLCG